MSDGALIIYDGECIFCQNYVRLLRLRERIGRVELVDARSGDPRIAQYCCYDLNEGMLLAYGEEIYHGAEAIYVLAKLSSTLFNRLNRAILSNPTAARLLYPLLRAGRNLTLAARGKPQIEQGPAPPELRQEPRP
ncbi:DCC1-like thiol-disulfide oxidoreductase family protein [Bradyrhizobium brasilense]|uniref:DCC1-like thiol-disulfide oxidoreductase family protein n=1 Tax=Bradyrhizobium brasilense TaxID=1419277 RepID=A0ABY8JNH4_9BRAD|nr:DCC1-like thiol-disulfide oxidoreductase family protein [Bradyrhizobium brasilense]WFU66719.1 DCC1-like thiol-disulfide oxidoreductase family protein [Bradyrhizobium brasilense]